MNKISFDDLVPLDFNSSFKVDNEMEIDSVRFSGVLSKTEDKMLELRNELDLLKTEVLDKLNDEDKYYDCESDESEVSSIYSDACNEVNPVIRFYFKRKDNTSKKAIICVTCHKEILTESYLTTDNLWYTLHINRNCVQTNGSVAVDFSRAKCFVYKLLRTHEELKQLLACGFYYNKITGFKPQNVAIKGFSAVHNSSNVPASKEYQFTYRRKDPTQKPTIACVHCKKPIYGTTYLTRGDSTTMTIHVKKNCVQCEDFSQAKCFVHKLLRNYNDLKKLLAIGFYLQNIIGVRPRNTDVNYDPSKPVIEDVEVTPANVRDVQFIFNDEQFICEQLQQSEKCQGCSKTLKKNDLCLRHKERIPREKLKETPLISQYYHPEKTCLLTRGFTDNYLCDASCYVISSSTDNHQRIEDMLVRCGLSGRNLKYGAACQDDVRHATPSSGDREDVARSYFFVVICTKEAAHCGGCAFNIEMNQACLLYGRNSLQNNMATLYHISKWCLRCRFTEREISEISCENNNSMADVSEEVLKGCGITKIKSRLRCESSGGRTDRSNPFKLNNPTSFIVDVSMDNRISCQACQERLQLDRYVLKAVHNGNVTATMHLDVECVRKCGFMPQQLSRSDLTLSVNVSRMAVARLEECGFRDVKWPQ